MIDVERLGVHRHQREVHVVVGRYRATGLVFKSLPLGKLLKPKPCQRDSPLTCRIAFFVAFEIGAANHAIPTHGTTILKCLGGLAPPKRTITLLYHS